MISSSKGKGHTGGRAKLTPYLVIMTLLLCTSCFLEGYDFFIVSIIEDHLARDFNVSYRIVLLGVVVINIGAIVGFFIIRLADRIGRKPVLLFSVAGYGALSVLTSFAPNLYVYVALQFLTKIFLVTEFNTAIIMVAEEYPDEIRGTAVAVLEVAGALGGSAAFLLSKPLLTGHGAIHGWRGMYLLGGAPLLLVPVMWVAVRETRHFLELKRAGKAKPQPLLYIWSTPSRRNTALTGILWFLCYLCYAGLIYSWILFAKTERGWTDSSVGKPMVIATVVGMLGYLVCGIMMDIIGRRAAGIVFFAGSAVSFVWAFQARGDMMAPAVATAMFFIFALLPICSTYNAELFPTSLRSTAAAWCNFLIGRPAQVLAPGIVSALAVVAGGIGNAASLLAIGPLIGALVVAFFLPETKGVKMDSDEPQSAG